MVSVGFSGGRNTAARPSDIDGQECSEGENFDLSLGNGRWRPRRPFDLVATATNAGPIRGYGQALVGNTRTTFIQAGDTVYEWDLASSFISRGTVNAKSRLRGPLTANWTAEDLTIVTDLEMLTPVSTFGPAGFSTMTHDLSGDFFAKYCTVSRERAFYAHVFSGVLLPHLIIGSGLEDIRDLTVTERPSSALSLADPFFIAMLDRKKINGMLDSFGTMVFSSEEGRIFKLAGNSPADYEILPLFDGSNASGDEALINIGNDVLIGANGRIDSLRSIESFSDTAADDVSLWIGPDVKNVTGWQMVYDRLLQRAFCFPLGGSEIHVFHKALFDSGLAVSPWSKWTTAHSFGFQAETIFEIIGPEGNPAVYMGGSAGEIFRVDGTGKQDGGTTDITSFRTSPLYKGEEPVTNVQGWVDYIRPDSDVTLNITWQSSGRTISDQAQTITLPTKTLGALYGGAAYYGGNFYYGSKNPKRISRQWFTPAGDGSGFQVKLSVTGSEFFDIDEFSFKAKEARP